MGILGNWKFTMRILLIGGISQSLTNFRGPLIQAMLAQGHDVLACAGEPLPAVATTLTEWGVQFIPIPLARAGMNPIGDIRTFFALCRVMRAHSPDAIFAYTIKPVIWGGFAARISGIPRFHALITGLGYAFMADDRTADRRPRTADLVDATDSDVPTSSPSPRRSTAWSPSPQSPHRASRAPRTDSHRPETPLKQRLAGWVARRLYKASLRHSRKVFFQNPDDRDAFVNLRLVDPTKCIVVSGSGIDLAHYRPTADGRPQTTDLPDNKKPGSTNPRPAISFLLIARLLRDKGICEYAEAAAIIKQDYPEAEFHLVGDYDPNPSGLKPAEVEAWAKAGTIIYHGQHSDVRPFLRDCSVYVLPSYREGTPRTVLEAMATGRAIITTDAPGCRETVRPKGGDQWAVGSWQLADGKLKIGANGILIPLRDAEALAEAMRFFIENPEQIAIMGRESRRYAEERYDVHKVNAVMLQEMGLG